MHPAKSYLLQLQDIEHEIQQLEWDMADIRQKIGLQGLRYDSDRVQTSAGDPMADTFARLDAMERKQAAKIEELKKAREKIHGQIRRVAEPYSQLLDLRYIRRLRFEKVADEMGYSADYIRRMHGKALQLFANANKATMEEYKWHLSR